MNYYVDVATKIASESYLIFLFR